VSTTRMSVLIADEVCVHHRHAATRLRAHAAAPLIEGSVWEACFPSTTQTRWRPDELAEPHTRLISWAGSKNGWERLG